MDASFLDKLDKIMNLKTAVFLVVLLFVVLVCGLLVSEKKPSPLKPVNPTLPETTPVKQTYPEVTIKPQSSVSLTILPSKKTVKLGDLFLVSVKIAGGGVNLTDIVLKYDPKVLFPAEIKEGKAFSKFFVKKASNGQINVAASIDPDNPKLSTSLGEIFSVNFKAVAPASSTAISFDRLNSITAKDGKNILVSAIGGGYTVTK